MSAPPTGQTMYEIRVERHLGTAVAAFFPAFTIIHDADGATTLRGLLPDQSALHGVLALIRDLGLTLIAVNRRDAAPLDDQGDET